MIDQEINQTIAAALGWSKLPKDPATMVQYTAQRPDGKWGNVPDYCNDLNAMHEAEKELTDPQRLHYAEELMDAVRRYPIGVVPDWHRDRNGLVAVATATACQRAEAFLKTLNLWKETIE